MLTISNSSKQAPHIISQTLTKTNYFQNSKFSCKHIRKNMAVSTLIPTIVTPNPCTFQPISSKPTSANFRATALSPQNPQNSATIISRKQICQVGLGLLAASIVGSKPLDANATRIEYYATTADPPCEFSYARSGLGYCDLAVGSGPEAPLGELINIHYTARFDDGIVFDSSYKRGRYLTMRIGVGKVIKGLDQGILGGEGVPPMQVGGKRKLQIPPHLAYGPEPAGCFSGDCNIPGNATLVYDVKFVGIYSGNRK